MLAGEGRYTTDITDEETLYLSFHRSQYGHARIEDVDTSAAAEQEGVVGVFTAADLAASDAGSAFHVEVSRPNGTATEQPLLAQTRVRYAGEPIAVVVAEDRYTAASAADAISVEYRRLDAVTDVASALESDAPTIHDQHATNRAFDWQFGDAEATDEAFETADVTVDVELENQRLVPNALEPRGAVAEFDPEESRLTVHVSSQAPYGHRANFAEILPLAEEQIRVVAPDVGGGFGSKGGAPYPQEAVTAWVALELERPVQWTATRTESFQTDHHGRDVSTSAELAVDQDGTIRGLRVDARFNLGAYVVWGKTPASNFKALLSGQYDVPAIAGRAVGALTNTTPVAPYRGAGRPEGIYVVERLVDRAASKLGMDPVELRLRNQIPSDAFPFETAVGEVYDSGNYGRALRLAVEEIDYEAVRERQAELRPEGRYLGIGIGCFVENTGNGPGRPEWGKLELTADGRLHAYCGTSDHGQGHETTFAQALADELDLPYDQIDVLEGDTDDLPNGVGTFSSRSATVGVSTLVTVARQFREQAREHAAEQLGVAPEDLAFRNGQFAVEAAPDASISLSELAAALDDGSSDGPVLDVSGTYDPESRSYSFGGHVAVVEVDPACGEIEILEYVAVDDCGVQFNPRIVEGQVHGGVAQGLGQALYERAVYDENGTLVSGLLQDYALPRAGDVPEMEVHETVTPCPHNLTGAKGVGESGVIGAPPTIVNAVVDALRPFDVDHLDMPLTAERVWRAIDEQSG